MAGWKVPTEGNSTPNQISPTEKRTGECNKGKEEGTGADQPAPSSIHTRTLSLHQWWREWKMQENIEESENWMTAVAWWWKLIQHWSNEKQKRWERSEKTERENDTGNSLKIVSADSLIHLDVLHCFSTWFTKEIMQMHKHKKIIAKHILHNRIQFLLGWF